MACYHLPVLLRGDHRGACREAGRRLCGQAVAGGGGHSRGHRQAAFHRQADCHRPGPGRYRGRHQTACRLPGVTVCRANFSQMEEVVRSLGVDSVDGVLMDIGVSSHQLDTPERGFPITATLPGYAYEPGGPLARGIFVNSLPWQELAEILSRYGEGAVFQTDRLGELRRPGNRLPIETTFQLAEIVKNAYPRRQETRWTSAKKKTFQALRIAVNGRIGQAFRGAGRRVFLC